MSFSKLYGQEGPIDVLKRAVAKRRVPHAFLFYGSEGVGKRTTAFEFAKALNCETGGADACDACASCRKIESGSGYREKRLDDWRTIRRLSSGQGQRGYGIPPEISFIYGFSNRNCLIFQNLSRKG